MYESACVHGLEDSFSEVADSDGNEQSLESFCVQVMLNFIFHKLKLFLNFKKILKK